MASHIAGFEDAKFGFSFVAAGIILFTAFLILPHPWSEAAFIFGAFALVVGVHFVTADMRPNQRRKIWLAIASLALIAVALFLRV